MKKNKLLYIESRKWVSKCFIVSLIIVFLLGSYMQYRYHEITEEMPNLKSTSISLLNMVTSVNFNEPNEVLQAELAGFNHQTNEPMYSDSASSGQNPQIDDKVITAIMQDIDEQNEVEQEKAAPVLQNMQYSHASDKEILIYHTHTRESWHSEIKENDKNANSKEVNITLVGKKLAEELEAQGIGAVVSDTDYASEVPNYEWAYSYKYSKKTVRDALAVNPNIKMIFDLHRDSQQRKYTTVTINGVDYAQVYFIIGKRNKNWEENEAFAEKLNAKLDELYPGLSRGIWGKNASSGHAEYNQSLHEQNVLVEVGGVDNTLEESYRTAKVLAEVIALIWEQ